MKNNNLVLGFTGFAFLAITGLALLFQNSTLEANLVYDERTVPVFEEALHERFLGREPCAYVEVVLDLNNEYCERIGRLQCNTLYKVKPNYKGDARVNSMNCLNQCERDVQAQCEHASSAFVQEGKR